MDENLPIAPPNHHKAPDEEYGWAHVADDMTSWDPRLRAIAEHHIRLQGAGQPSLTPDAALADPGHELPQYEEAQDEVIPLMPARPEGHNTAAQERAAAFAFGKDQIYKILGDAEFHEECESMGLDPYDDENPAYWDALANFTHNLVEDMVGHPEDNPPPQDILRYRALELMAMTPSYILAQQRLGTNAVQDRAEKYDLLRKTADLHGSIIDLVEQFPDLKATELEVGFMNIINMSMNAPKQRQYAENNIKGRIWGIQHEFAFYDILRHTGLKFREATPEEDTRDGFDYLVDEGELSQMKLDVKASLREVDPDNGASPIVQKGYGKYAVYSMISKHELRGGFRISDTLARTKAAALLAYLNPGGTRLAAQYTSEK